MRGQIGERSLTIAAEVIAVADELGVTPTQVAIAWVRRGEGNIIPLVGAKTILQLEENLGCLDVELEDAHMERLNAVSHIAPGFPHDMLGPQAISAARRIENHRRSTTPRPVVS